MIRKKRYRYQDFVDELTAGHAGGIFIDDTGSPGLQTQSSRPADSKSWVAVIVPQDQMAEVYEQLPRALKGLEEIVSGAKEFHFTDIYAGRQAFKGVDAKVRLAILDFMAYIFSQYKFPVIVQTLSSDSRSYIQSTIQLPKQLGPLVTDRHDDLALIFLILRLKQFITSKNLAPMRLFIDEGRLRNGATIVIESLDTVFRDGLICFANSRSIYPIQLADFAAFILNRWQILLSKKGLSDFDRRFLQIASPVAELFVNIGPDQAVDKLSLSSLKV